MIGQISSAIDDELARKIKQAVLAKRGKTQISHEREEALKLYLDKNKDLRAPRSNRKDPIIRVIGALKSSGRYNALDDLRRLDSKNA